MPALPADGASPRKSVAVKLRRLNVNVLAQGRATVGNGLGIRRRKASGQRSRRTRLAAGTSNRFL